jgi:hypothetical protein
MGDNTRRSVYRSLSTRVYGLLAIGCLTVLGVWLVAGYLQAGKSRHAVIAVGVCVVAAASAVELLWRPAVRVTQAGVELVNPVRTTLVPWPLLEATEPAFGLRVLTADWHYRAWAASGGPGKGGSWAVGRGITGDNPMGAPVGMGASAGPTMQSVMAGGSGRGESPAKMFVDQAWQAWQGSHRDGSADPKTATVVTRWHWDWMAAVLIVCALTAVVAGAVS